MRDSSTHPVAAICIGFGMVLYWSWQERKYLKPET
jgi:hypothetical protein